MESVSVVKRESSLHEVVHTEDGMVSSLLHLEIEAVSNLQPVIPENIQDFAASRNMSIAKINGQRIYGPVRLPWSDLWSPGKGTEVFIKNLPHDCFEPELVPVLELVAPIYQLRLMLNFSGNNKGFCFVKFYSRVEADSAIYLLHRFQIRDGVFLRVRKSLDNCRLILSGVPTYKSPKEVFDELNRVSGGVERVFVSWDFPQSQVANVGVVTVAYQSHRLAAAARSVMMTSTFQMWGYRVKVDWAEPEDSSNRVGTCNQIAQIMCVKKVADQTSNDTLRLLFNAHSSNGVLGVQRKGSMAFIEFGSRQQGEMARAVLDGISIDNSIISIEWFDPRFI